jgi:hypothetical protein
MTFKAMECLNKAFPFKILLAVYKRYLIWLKECKFSINRNEVNDSIIDFSSIVSQVMFGTFHMDLPSTFKIVAPEEFPAPGKGGKHPKPEGDNKQKTKRERMARSPATSSRTSTPTPNYAWSQTQRGPYTLQTSMSTSIHSETKRSDAALPGPSKSTAIIITLLLKMK